MSFLNLNYGIISYKDPSPTNPKNRLGGDITKSYQGVVTQNAQAKEIVLCPGESKEIVATTRALGTSATTEFEFVRPISDQDTIRLQYTGTGTAPNFRNARALSVDATTEITTTRVAPNAVRFQRTAGTAMVTTSVQVGDTLQLDRDTDTFTSPWSEVNRGKEFIVQSKGSDYIDVIDNQAFTIETSPVVLGADFAQAFKVFSSGSVKLGDTISILGSNINQSNKGNYVVTSVSSDYIEYVNSYAVAETITNTDNMINIYDYLIGFVHLIGTHAFKIKINDSDAFDVGMFTSTESLFLGSVSAYKIEAINESDNNIGIDAQFSSVVC